MPLEAPDDAIGDSGQKMFAGQLAMTELLVESQPEPTVGELHNETDTLV